MQRPSYPDQRLITVRQFCERYHLGMTKAYALLAAGHLRAVKNGRSTLIRIEDAEAWVDSLPTREVA